MKKEQKSNDLTFAKNYY